MRLGCRSLNILMRRVDAIRAVCKRGRERERERFHTAQCKLILMKNV